MYVSSQSVDFTHEDKLSYRRKERKGSPEKIVCGQHNLGFFAITHILDV